MIPVLALLLLVVATPAHAVKPETFPIGDFVLTLDAGAVCPFPVQIETLQNKEVVRIYFDQEGNFVRGLITGRLFVRYTNLDTRASVTLPQSGPGQFYPDGRLVALGVSFLGLIKGIDEGAPALLQTRGRVTLRRTEFGGLADIVITSHRVDDICALIA
ncbi:MAG TPA: hypothetical protein VEQ37_19005 [Actinomycetota bacterium]|nr:hypothetical protein [Actinomycetota bacterium]